MTKKRVLNYESNESHDEGEAEHSSCHRQTLSDSDAVSSFLPSKINTAK